MHTLLDLRGNIPTFIHFSDGKMHDVNILDILVPEAGAFYIMDRGYRFRSPARLARAGASSSRVANRTPSRRRYSQPSTKRPACFAIRPSCLTGLYFAPGFRATPAARSILDPETGKRLVFLTNNFALPALHYRRALSVAAGRSSCSSNGSSSTFVSRCSSAHPRTP